MGLHKRGEKWKVKGFFDDLLYKHLFDINKAYLEKMSERIRIQDEIREKRQQLYNLSLGVVELEEKMRNAVKKIERKEEGLR